MAVAFVLCKNGVTSLFGFYPLAFFTAGLGMHVVGNANANEQKNNYEELFQIY